MALPYRIHNQSATYFVTFTVHQWVDVFTRKDYVEILIESLRYCKKNKGLKIYAWVVMTNHCHLIVRSEGYRLSDVIRDFKKYTAKAIFEAIDQNEQESRKRWLKWLLYKEGNIWFWEDGCHGIEISDNNLFESKSNYIHLNPVRAGIVEKEEEYLWSSCADFYGFRKGPLEVEIY
jgi:REP element-mobilizing transposase RayT